MRPTKPIVAFMLALLLGPGVAYPAGNAPAASAVSPNWYDIELIVFRYTDPQAGAMETWPADPGVPDWNAATPLLAAADTTTPLKPGTAPAAPIPFMQNDTYQLNGEWNRLEHSNGYQPVLHVAWSEPLTDHATALAVRIGVPPAAPVVGNNAGFALPAPTPATAASPGTPAPAAPTPVYGTVKFSQYAPYLHLDVDLVCQGPVAKHLMVSLPVASSQASPAAASGSLPAPANQPADAPTMQWYRMTQDRRIESGRLNYFDNPMFGVLVLVTPHPLPTTPVK
ncbi:MAG TPA: CsiV family protein [Gammaproteobacteria bacterium]|nr:CsiV family protein [Gammaproteobacteria bacterium]